jgi:HlyD family secretion protein
MKLLTRPAKEHVAIEEMLALPALKLRRRWVLVLALVLVLIVGTVAVVGVRSSAAVSYDTVLVARRDLEQLVTATGTVNPQNTVLVGTQESGTVSEIDADYNSHVRKSEVIARLDPATLQAVLDQANAALAQARAQARAAAATASGARSGVGSADATQRAAQATAEAARATARASVAAMKSARSNVSKAESAVALALQTVARDRQLIAPGYIAQSQLDTDRSNLVAQQTGLQAAEAAFAQERAQARASESQAIASSAQVVTQTYTAASAGSTAEAQAENGAAAQSAVAAAEANVKTAQSNLSKTVITSPVDGTVVARDVSVGTTVAAGLQTPTLFSIAQNLQKMEVDVAVGEPDIGYVRAGDDVDFTVLAYPNQTFHGTVSQLRINPTTTNNVVTYTTVVLVNNRDGKLLPGMTANASIHVAKARNSLVVPLAALSYRSSLSGPDRPGAPPSPRSSNSGNAKAITTSPWGTTYGSPSANVAVGKISPVFVQREGKRTPVAVRVDLVSGTQAAVTAVGGVLTEGDAVVTSETSTAAGRTPVGAANNPLTGGGPGPGGPGPMR